jgi:hypothetical protein
MNGLTVVPLLLAFFAITLAYLERRERRRQEAELDRLRALLAARNGNRLDWIWPDGVVFHPHEEEQS